MQHTVSTRPCLYSLGVPEQARRRAEVVIPQAWLNPKLAIDAVRALQPGDTSAEMEKGELRLSGVEVLVARNWVRDEFWPRIQDAVRTGYPAEKTYTFLRVHSERRSIPRPARPS
jgi:hypothetical protein